MTILFLGPVWRQYREMAEARLGEGHRVCFGGLEDSPDLVPLIREAHVIVTSFFSAEQARHAGNLRLLQVGGAGFEKIALDALPRNLPVCQTFGHGSSIAEYVVMTMLALSRRLLSVDRRLRKGNWLNAFRDEKLALPSTLAGRRVLVLGTGEIGTHVARLCRAFGMHAVGVNRTGRRVEPFDEAAAAPDLDGLLPSADFVVLALPLADDTRGMIGPSRLEMLKPGACLINVARGPLVEETALFEALASGRIAGAALDVWYRYPGEDHRCDPAHLPFASLPNVIMTPHISGVTRETFDHRMVEILDNIERLERGEPLLHPLQRSMSSGKEERK